MIEITHTAEQVRRDIASERIDEAGLAGAMLAKDRAILLNQLWSGEAAGQIQRRI